MTTRRGWLPAAAVALVALAGLAVLALPSPARAATMGSGYWYWPTGSEDFGGMSGFWADRGNNWHLAQDMACPEGHPVYAVGDGIVLESKYVSGYGPGYGSGGCVVILHRTAFGAPFKAVYGHLKNLVYAKGASVKAGAIIGYINGTSPNHLHFGIHPGIAYPPDNNPFRGHTYDPHDTYGFVDPVAYLRKNPRLVICVPPVVPVVANVATTVTPLWVSVGSGAVYWSVHATEGTATVSRRWSYTIATRVRRQLVATDSVPAAERLRYYSVFVKTPAPMVRVYDKLPRLSFSVSSARPVWGSSIRTSGHLINASGRPFGGAHILVEQFEGGAWRQRVWTYTTPTGAWSVCCVPTGGKLRAWFGPTRTYSEAFSAGVDIRPIR